VKTTPLHEAHVKLGAKMGEFAGYDMPLYYSEGVIAEHDWVRERAGLFDVSHMGQVMVEGRGVAHFWERLTPSPFQAKADGRAQYTVLCNENGGIIDDLIITRLEDNKFFAVINAGCKDKDLEWIKSQLPDNLSLTHMDDHALLALQGQKAEAALGDVLGLDMADLPYMHARYETLWGDTPVLISRLGYTGEDGFEISMPAAKAPEIWDALLAHEDIKPIGLAARDTLRLEMGYPLYGHDIDDTTSPVEAAIWWIISKKTSGYFGYERIQKEMMHGARRKRVGLRLIGKGVAREGAKILSPEGREIGVMTSGGHSPSLKASIGQGYVQPSYADEGTKVLMDVRGRQIEAEVVALSHIPPRTKSMKKA